MSKLYHFPDQSSYRNLEKNAQEIFRQWCRIYLVYWWENIYGIAAHKNSQNDCVYVSATLRKRHVALARLLRTRSYFSQSLMVSVGVSKLGKTQLVFVDPGVKINGAYYRNVLLTQQLLPVMREISGAFFISQEDSAPAHRARETFSLLEQQETSAFISPDLWPPKVPIWNQWTTEFGNKWKSVSTRPNFMTSINWSSVWSMSGMVRSKASTTMQFMSGANDFVRAFKRKEDTLSI